MLVHNQLLVLFILLEVSHTQISYAGREFALVVVIDIINIKMSILHVHFLNKCKNLVALVLVQEI